MLYLALRLPLIVKRLVIRPMWDKTYIICLRESALTNRILKESEIRHQGKTKYYWKKRWAANAISNQLRLVLVVSTLKLTLLWIKRDHIQSLGARTWTI